MGWVVNVMSRPIYPQERDSVPNVQDAGWAPGTVWTGAENLTHTGIRSSDRPTHSKPLSCPGGHSKGTRFMIRRELTTKLPALCPLVLLVAYRYRRSRVSFGKWRKVYWGINEERINWTGCGTGQHFDSVGGLPETGNWPRRDGGSGSSNTTRNFGINLVSALGQRKTAEKLDKVRR